MTLHWRAHTYMMVAHVANCCDCGMRKKFIMMQLTISRDRLTIVELWKKGDIHNDLEGYFELCNSPRNGMPCCRLRFVYTLMPSESFCESRLQPASGWKWPCPFKTKNRRKPCRTKPAAIIKLSSELSGVMPAQARSECSDSTSFHH